MWTSRLLLVTTLMLGLGPSASADAMPDGFVYLKDYVPDIRQDIRYAGRQNFMRKRLPGYGAKECVLTEAAAKALAKVQNAAVQSGYSLVVFDCYRPQTAVDAMVAWVGSGQETDREYYPSVPRSQLIRQGYIGAKSSHARGSTVDVSLEFLDVAEPRKQQTVCARGDRGTADFGTPFDCFDPASRTDAKVVGKQAQQMRKKLVELMRLGNFRNYAGEWWHFTLRGEPFPNRSFSFAIEKR